MGGGRLYQSAPSSHRLRLARPDLFRPCRGVAHHALQHRQIVEKTLAAGGSQADFGQRTVTDIALVDVDQAGFLQHGSVMLGAAPHRLARIFPTTRDPLAGMTTLEAVLGRRPSFDEGVRALADGFRGVHGLALSPGGLDAEELERAESLVRDKYATERWTRSGRAPVVATAIG